MRLARTNVVVFLCFVLAISAFAQQAVTSPPQPAALLQNSLAVISGRQSLADVTLSGAARRIVGSDDEAGTGVFKAIAGAGRVDLALSSGLRHEGETLNGGTPAGSWSGPDGVSHRIAFHNLLAEPAWFFPALAISRRLSDSGYVATYVGRETRNGQVVEHLSVYQTPSTQDSPGAPTFQHLTEVDFFLDSTTLLPAAITFNTHPDNDAGLDLPVEIRFSDYRLLNDAQIPFHIQKFLNNSLILDFQAQSVTLNSGLTAAQFIVQ